MQGQVLLNLAALCLWYSSYSSVGLLEYKSVVTLQEEQSEPVQNGRTLGKSVDRSKIEPESIQSPRIVRLEMAWTAFARRQVDMTLEVMQDL